MRNPPTAHTPGSSRGRYLSVLVRLLCVALVPVLVLGTDTAARAATVNGPRADFTFTYSGGVPGSSVDCTTANYWSASDGVSQQVNGSTGGCSLGWGTGDSWDVVMTFTGNHFSTGELCEGTYAADEVNIAQPWSYSTGVTYGCQIDEACITAVHDGYGDDKRFESCSALAVGGPTTKNITTCPLGAKPNMPQKGLDVLTGNSLKKWTSPITYSFTTSPVGPNDPWKFYAVRAARPGASIYWETMQAGMPGVTPTVMIDITETPISSSNPASVNPDKNLPVIGYGLARSTSSSAWNNLPQTNAAGVIGLNDPAKCSYYWGAKIAELAGDTDVPEGPIGTQPPTGTETPPDTTTPPPSEVPNECTFSLRDPSSWLNAGMCAAVGLLGAIFGAVKELASAVLGIPGAILNGLSGLFVPSSGFFDDKFGEVETVFDDTAPGQYVESVETLAPSGTASGGCDGPSFDISIMDVDKTIKPLSACSGAAANAAALVKLLLTVGLGVFGAIACLRGIGSGLGWNVSIGRGADT